MSRKTIRICVVDTVYTLWLSLIKFGINQSDYFVFSTGIPEDIRKNFNHYFFPKTNVKFSKKSGRAISLSPKDLPGNLGHVFEILKLKRKLSSLTRNSDVKVYGHGHLKFSFPLYVWPDNAIVEDGFGNYNELKKPTKFKYPRLAHFCGFYFKFFKQGFGTHENIHKICLTKENYPDIIKGKVEVMDVEALWQQKSDAEKNQILELFNMQDIYDKFTDNSTLLLTQSLSEDDLLDYDEEIAIYRQFVEKYPDLIIKTHPRETKDYREIFPDVTVIDTPFPIEMFKFLGIPVKKILTISSTAALNFKGDADIELYEGQTSREKFNDSLKKFREIYNE